MNPIKYNPNRAIKQLPAQLIDIQSEIRINDAFRKIMSTPMTDEQRRQELTQLLRERASLLHHVPVNGLKGSVIFFNMKQIGLAPTPPCQAYNKMRVPTISAYHYIASNIGIVLLDDSAIRHVPKGILEKAGNLSGKQVEFLWTAIDGRSFSKMNRPINLCIHPWAHPHALVDDDVAHDVHMGIFPEIGFQPCRNPGAIAFNGISPMRVHTHPGKGTMLFSPDNAHFEVIPESPFGVFWSAIQKDNRVAFSKMLVIFDYDHPICACLLESIRNCNDLGTHLTRLQKVDACIQKTLTLPDHNFMDAFDALPPAFQYGIYVEAWLLFDSPRGVHGDFGRASLKNDPSLGAKFHCTHDQRKQAVAHFAKRLKELLIDSQMDLTLHSQPLQKGNNTLRMMQCAHFFEEANAANETFKYSNAYDRETQIRENKAERERISAYQAGREAEVMKLFSQFSPEEKEAVYLAIWELSKCPRGNSKFGAETLLSQKTEFTLKAQAFLLAASRQTPKFDEPLIPAAPPVEIVQNNPEIEIDQPQVPILMETRSSLSTPSAGLTPQQVLEAMINLAFDEYFIGLSPSDRKNPVMELFNHLPLQIKNSIYGKVYEYSTDAKKGGGGWGEAHVADDLNVLIDALQDILG